MNKSAYPIFVSLVALVLISPAIGVSYNVVEDESRLFSTSNLDFARVTPPYAVMLEYDVGNSQDETITRNKEITIDFIIRNEGSN